jgi:heme oxygenase (biliverdin-producing, ferredoxin)
VTTFAARLRRATMIEHREAETRDFVSRLLAGRVPPAGFAALTSQCLVIYRELEAAAGRMRSEPRAAPFADPALSRVATLEADLAHLYGTAGRSAAPLEATRRYVHRLRARCHTSPAHFIAHHYVRYLGDLSGGQVVGRAVAEAYGLGRAGVSFYTFDQIADPTDYKAAYRERLDALPAVFGAGELATLIAEARRAFRLNAAVLTELGAAFPPDPCRLSAGGARSA